MAYKLVVSRNFRQATLFTCDRYGQAIQTRTAYPITFRLSFFSSFQLH